MARNAHRDGRPVIVVTFADSDPSGWQMPLSIARKFQALAITHFPGLHFRGYRAGLTPAQVAALDSRPRPDGPGRP